MRRRLLGTIVAVTAFAILLFGVPLALVALHMVDEQAVLRLERQAVLATRTVPAGGDSGDPVELPTSEYIAYALYDTSGVLLAGIGPPTADDLTRRALANTIVDGEIDETLVVAVPVVADERVTGAIRAQQATSIIDRRAQKIFALLALLATGVMAMATILASILATRISRPIRLLRDATVQLGTGDFAIETPHHRIPELADTANALAATARRLDELISRERAFSADASHQLRTPLTGMRAMIETELAFPRPDSRDALQEALTDIDRLEATITELLTIARNATIPAEIDLDPVLDEVAAAWKSRFQAANRTLTIAPVRYRPHPLGHSTMLRHALDILIDNSLIHGRGTTSIELNYTDDTVTLSVCDEGDGFPTDADTQPAPVAHGHGLPLARRLASAMHGRLTLPKPGAQPRVDLVLRRPRSHDALRRSGGDDALRRPGGDDALRRPGGDDA